MACGKPRRVRAGLRYRYWRMGAVRQRRHCLRTGYSYLSYFFGISIVFFLAPIFLIPLQRLKQTHQLETLTDVLVYRYRSLIAGIFITFLMIIMTLPLLALQIEALDQLLNLLLPHANTSPLIFTFLIAVGLFIMYFGIRSPERRYGHPSLIGGMALLSLVKYSALLLLVGVSFHRVFGDFAALQSWLDQNPLALERLYSSTRQAPWHNLNLAFCTSVVALPHLFHVVLSNKHENIKTFFIATWAFPAPFKPFMIFMVKQD
ncbi:MAG: hypothetical protein P8077_09130, partial [Gammaproteobacteria bacterium]